MMKLLMIVLFVIASQHEVFAQTTAQSICDSKGAVGNFPNPDDGTCKQYAKCFVKNGALIGSYYNCTGTTLFNPTTQLCVVGYTCTPVTTTILPTTTTLQTTSITDTSTSTAAGRTTQSTTIATSTTTEPPTTTQSTTTTPCTTTKASTTTKPTTTPP